MDYKGYMSEVLDIGYVKLTDSMAWYMELILRFELKAGHFSVYQLSKFTKKHLVKPIAYKNVHTMVQKLYNSRLIEQINGHFPRGAKFYKISNRGWFNLLKNGSLYSSSYLGRRSLIDLYDKNIFFKTFFYPYFEKETIEHFSGVYLTFLLYLDECMMITENYLEIINKKWLSEQLSSEKPITLSDLDSQINSFLIKLAIEEVEDMKAYKTSWAIDDVKILSHDKKYMNALSEAKKQFDLSYKSLR